MVMRVDDESGGMRREWGNGGDGGGGGNGDGVDNWREREQFVQAKRQEILFVPL